jgi:putative methionine-R-sulfoxide reductase with GAF domain
MKTSSIDNDTLERRTRRNWMLLVGICVASTLGLATAVLPILETRIDSPWPWRHTEIALLSALLMLVLGAVYYLNDQQRRAARIHRELLRAREKAAERMRRHNAQLEALLSVSRIMAAETSLQAVFDSVSKTCLEAFECQQVSLMLLDKDTQELEVRSASGHANAGKVIGSRVKVGQGVAGYVAAKGESLVLGPGAVDPMQFQSSWPQDSLSAAVVVPILVRGELVGVMNVGSTSPLVRYDDEDVQALKVFAENVGTCIRHTEQAEWMRQMIHKLDPSRPESAAAR